MLDGEVDSVVCDCRSRVTGARLMVGAEFIVNVPTVEKAKIDNKLAIMTTFIILGLRIF